MQCVAINVCSQCSSNYTININYNNISNISNNNNIQCMCANTFTNISQICQCQPLYSYTHSQCILCSINNCQTCISTNICNKCIVSYILINNTCNLCNVTGCSTCNNNNTSMCNKCSQNYILNNGKCVCQPPFIVSNSVCTCPTNYTAYNNQCIFCTVPGCAQCKSPNICAQCSSLTFYPSYNT